MDIYALMKEKSRMIFWKGGLIILAAIFCTPLFSSAQTLYGKLLNENEKPVSGAFVSLLNTQLAAITNKEGIFYIPNIQKGNYLFNVSANGYSTEIFPIQITDSITKKEIILHPYFKELNEVIVSAQKREELLQHSPASITALPARLVNDFSIWNINELTSIAPNLYVANPGDKRNVTSIRGIVSTSYEPAVTTYIDGVNQFGLDTYIPQLFDVERIEITRGPQGTLYGRNAMGGVINILTKQPKNRTEGFAEMSVGSFGQKRVVAGIKTPIIQDRLFLGAAGLYEQMNGFYKNLFDNSDYDKQNAIGGNYYLKYQTKTNWNFTLNLKHTANRNHGTFPLVLGVEEAFKNPFTLNQNAISKMVDNVFNTSVYASYTGRTINFSSQTAYQYNYRYYQTPIDADFSPIDGISIINNYGKDWNNVKVFTQELKLSSTEKNNHKLTWTTGSYLFFQHSPVKQAIHFGKDAALVGAEDQNFSLINSSRATNKGIAFYGQAAYKFTKEFEVTAGLRYDYEKKQQSVLGEYALDPDPNPLFAYRPDTSAVAGFSAFSPKMTLAYYPSSKNTFFITYGKGFRAGGLTPLSSNPTQPALFAFKPETSHNIEVGTKNILLNKKLILNLTAFYAKVSDVQVPTLILPDAVTITKNTGRLTSNGLELEAGSTFNGLELLYSFGYTHAIYDDLKLSQNNTELNLAGNHQIFTPEITSNFAVQYTIGLNDKRSVLLVTRGEWQYLGKQYFDLANSIMQVPYHLLNVKFGISTKNFSIKLWGRNLTNSRYISYAYDFGAVHLGDPARYGLTVNVNI